MTAQEEMSEKELAREMKVWQQTLDRHRREVRWIELAKVGGKSEIENMAALLRRDPAELQRYAAWDPRRLVNAVDEHNRTALFYAAMRGNERLMTWLLDLCADPRICAECVHEEERRIIEREGVAAPTPQVDDYESPMEVAARWGHLTVLNMLLDLHPKESAKKEKQNSISRSFSEGDVLSQKRSPRYKGGPLSVDVPNLTYVYAKADLKRALKGAKGAGHEATVRRLKEYISDHKSNFKLKSLVQRFKMGFARRGSKDAYVVQTPHGHSTVYAGGKSPSAKKSATSGGFSAAFDPHHHAAHSLTNGARNASMMSLR